MYNVNMKCIIIMIYLRTWDHPLCSSPNISVLWLKCISPPTRHAFLHFPRQAGVKEMFNWLMKLGFTCPAAGTVTNCFNCLENLALMTQHSWVIERNTAALHSPFALYFPSNPGSPEEQQQGPGSAAHAADFLLQVTALNGSAQMNESSIYQGNLNQWFCKMYSAPIKQLIRKVKAHFAHIYHSRPDPFNTITSLLCY